MSISVQSPAAPLTALDNLAISAGSTGAAQAATQVPNIADQDQTASILDINGALGVQGGDAETDLGSAVSIADTATSAGAAITDLLTQMRQAAVSASDPSLGGSARAALNASYQTDIASLQSVVGQAGVDGMNLIDGSLSGAVQAPPGGTTTATLTATNLSVGGPVIGPAADSNLLDPASAAAAADSLDTAIGAVGQAVGRISAQGQSIQDHLDVLGQASLAASGSSADPPLDDDGARLQALQVQQQLSVSGQAIGNQAPQAILALFR